VQGSGEAVVKTLVLSVVPLFLLFSLLSCRGKMNEAELLAYVRAAEAYRAGHFREAADAASAIGNFVPVLLLRGKAEYFLGNTAAAEKYFNRAMRGRRGTGEAALYLVRVYREEGREAEALRLAEKILESDPSNTGALRLAASLNRDSAAAASLLDRAVEASGETALVYLDRARFRWTAGRAEEALEDLRKTRILLPEESVLVKSVTNLERAIRQASYTGEASKE
jgi:tetratricopeptide (TPR) repeat protein